MPDSIPPARTVEPDPVSIDDWTVGYCTNVHAGTDLATIRENLVRFAGAVRASVSHGSELGVGLWLPAEATQQLATDADVESFAEFLRTEQLCPFTINAFPYDNFHQDVVKHRVYLPAWWQTERLDYTHRLAEILAKLLPNHVRTGSISTLPIGWPNNPSDPNSSDVDLSDPNCELLNQAGANFRELADRLRSIESQTGRRIVVAIEPEPGCILDTTDDVITWFDRHLPDSHHRRYLTVCHDVCHAAVMGESQSDVLNRLAAAGIGIGKVQVSSAVVAEWDAMAVGRRQEAIKQLAAFAEDRYLHQTGRVKDSGEFELVEDLPALIASAPPQGDPVQGDRRWIVHFHVPIFLERFGHLTTSHSAVLDCLNTLAQDAQSSEPKIDFTGHLEIETYAWTVLPESMRKRGLADDIASEIVWIRKAIAQSI